MTSEAEAYARDLDSGRIGVDFVRRRIQALRSELAHARGQGAGREKILGIQRCLVELQRIVKQSGRLRTANRGRSL